MPKYSYRIFVHGGANNAPASDTPSFDSDAQAFFDAAGITDATEKDAVNDLVLDLKSNSLWTMFDAIYPMVGGTATTTKYNLKDPQDTDGAFRLTYTGSWTYSSTGIQGDGSGTVADTHVVPSTDLSQNDTHISFYSRTDSSTAQNVEMGISDGNKSYFIAPKYQGNNTNYRAVNSSQTSPGSSPTSTGLFQANRISSTEMKLFRNGTAINTDTQSSNGVSTRSIYVGGYNQGSGGAQYPTDRECAFASIGDGMTDAEASTFYDIVQDFQTALSRQV